MSEVYKTLLLLRHDLDVLVTIVPYWLYALVLHIGANKISKLLDSHSATSVSRDAIAVHEGTACILFKQKSSQVRVEVTGHEATLFQEIVNLTYRDTRVPVETLLDECINLYLQFTDGKTLQLRVVPVFRCILHAQQKA